MKAIKILGVIVLLFIFGTVTAQPAIAEVKIKTSAVCEMCKDRIEKAVIGINGVKSANLDVNSKVITVKYNSSLTNPDKIRQSISNTGYDADNLKANAASYKKLPSCCQKS
jgi:copper chaperone CopZ